MKRKLSSQHILIILFAIGFILRITGLFNITLAGDFEFHWCIAEKIVIEGFTPLLGPTASVNDALHLGPFYYYLLSIPYALGGGNYKIAIIFFSLLNSLSIFVLFYALKHWFTDSTSLKITSLYTFSAYMISVQNFPWNPYVLPTLITLILFLIAKIQKKEFSYIPALAVTMGLSIQSHATALFLFPVVILLLPLKKIPHRFIILGLFSFLLTMSSWIYVDVTSNFSQTKEALAVFQPSETTDCSLTHYIKNHGNGERCFGQIRNSIFVARMFTTSLFNTRNLLIVSIFSLLSAYFILKEKFKQKYLILLWVGIPWILYLFYSSNVYLHYFLIFFPIPFILCTLILEKISSINSKTHFLSNVLFYLILILNLVITIQQLPIMRG